MTLNPVKKTFSYGAHQVTLETGEMARQASGAVVVNMDDSVVLCTVVAAKQAAPGRDFLPLTCDYVLQVNTVRFHPLAPDWVYVGTDLGVFASEDKGLTWRGLPLTGAGHDGPANVVVSELFWQGTTHLIAATHGRGMYRAAIQTGIWVDPSNPNAGDGSFGNPFQSLKAALNAQSPGTPIYIKGGTFQQGNVLFDKRGRVWTPSGPVIIK